MNSTHFGQKQEIDQQTQYSDNNHFFLYIKDDFGDEHNFATIKVVVYNKKKSVFRVDFFFSFDHSKTISKIPNDSNILQVSGAFFDNSIEQQRIDRF